MVAKYSVHRPTAFGPAVCRVHRLVPGGDQGRAAQGGAGPLRGRERIADRVSAPGCRLPLLPTGLIEADGLAQVDESDIPYFVTGFFGRPPDGADLLTVEELVGRDLFAVVIEDDHEPCPVPTNEGTLVLLKDDLIGISPIFRGEDLDIGVAFSFDDVTWLAIDGVR